jgi:diguanylate cyclase (GGDEF)-like protein
MGTINKISAFWQRRSLRFWLATGMLMTLCPIFIAAVAGHHLYHRAIIRPLVEVSSQQRKILQPLQSLRLSLVDVSNSVIDYSVDGDAGRAEDYKRLSDGIDADLARLITAVKDHELEVRDVNKSRDDWRDVATVSRSILSGQTLHGIPLAGQRIKEFEAKMDRLDHHLAKVYGDVDMQNEQTHKEALSDLEHSQHLAVAAFVVSIISAILGITLINRSLVKSMDKLAFGALRLAAGDREHNIEVHVPRELVSVADAFNLMTSQILEQEAALLLAARTDGLTGLYNRREFDRMLAAEIQRGKQYATIFSLLIGDIDHFKKFNDTCGHQAGDGALRAVSQILKEGLREGDKACRFGGEEFVLILSECDAEAALQTAERLRVAVEELEIVLDGDQTANVTMSLGGATYPADGATPQSLLKSADSALYVSKEHGRNRVTIASEPIVV